MKKATAARVDKLEQRADVVGRKGKIAEVWAAYLETEPPDSIMHKLDALGITFNLVGYTPQELEQWRAIRRARVQQVEDM